MIELVAGMPAGTVGLVASGQVSAQDYTDVVDPAIAAALAEHDKVRLLYVMEPGVSFTAGASWQDVKVGVPNLGRFERIAAVCDEEWIRRALDAFHWLVPGEIRTFPLAQRDEARDWITG